MSTHEKAPEALTIAERQRMADYEHDVAYAVVNGYEPRAEAVETLRALYAKRDEFYAQQGQA